MHFCLLTINGVSVTKATAARVHQLGIWVVLTEKRTDITQQSDTFLTRLSSNPPNWLQTTTVATTTLLVWHARNWNVQPIQELINLIFGRGTFMSSQIIPLLKDLYINTAIYINMIFNWAGIIGSMQFKFRLLTFNGVSCRYGNFIHHTSIRKLA